MNDKKIAFLFPGQGAQHIGMGRDFVEKFPEAAAVFAEADAILGRAISELIFNGNPEELSQTKNSQLAIFIVSIAILRVFEAQFSDMKPAVCAGLSLGEYTALIAAKKMTFAEGLKLVAARATFMQEACENHPGTMQVVLGLDLSAIEEALSSLDGVWIANLNCPGQIVISGTVSGIEKAVQILKEKGARRILPLDVSGAFHSGLMQDAQDKLEPLIRQTKLTSSPIDIVMNTPGDYVTSTDEMRENMICQVTLPVHWQHGVEQMVAKGVELFIEMGPGKTLAGMNKKIGVASPTVSLEKVEDLQGVFYAPAH